MCLLARAYDYDAGQDVIMKNEVVLKPGESAIIGLGFRCDLMPGEVGFIKPRSSSPINLYIKDVPIDTSYTGEVHLMCKNIGDEKLTLEVGKAYCQLVIFKLSEANGYVGKLGKRQKNNFGSSNRID